MPGRDCARIHDQPGGVMYTKSLPHITDIAWVSTRVAPYPAHRAEIVRIARRWNLPDSVIEFLRQFPADEVFTSRADLVTRCENLALLIRQEWESPAETFQSPQD